MAHFLLTLLNDKVLSLLYSQLSQPLLWRCFPVPSPSSRLWPLLSVLSDCAVFMSWSTGPPGLCYVPGEQRLFWSRWQLSDALYIALNRHLLTAHRLNCIRVSLKRQRGSTKDPSPTDSHFLYRLPKMTLWDKYHFDEALSCERRLHSLRYHLSWQSKTIFLP